jgi:hypothetical protein
MDGNHPGGANPARDAFILDPLGRAAAFAALGPALETLVGEANTDARLSPQARRILRAVAGTGPTNTLALAELAARASTPKARVLTALNELEVHGYLTRLARTAPHLVAALPPHTHPKPADTR